MEELRAWSQQSHIPEERGDLPDIEQSMGRKVLEEFPVDWSDQEDTDTEQSEDNEEADTDESEDGGMLDVVEETGWSAENTREDFEVTDMPSPCMPTEPYDDWGMIPWAAPDGQNPIMWSETRSVVSDNPLRQCLRARHHVFTLPSRLDQVSSRLLDRRR